MATKNFANSLKRSRTEFGHTRANNLAIEAYEAKTDVLRELNSEIRNIKNQLTAVEDDTYDDPLMIALKKGTTVDVRKQVVDARFSLLLKLRELIIKKKLFTADNYFDLPEDFDTETISPSTDGPAGGDEIDDVIAATS